MGDIVERNNPKQLYNSTWTYQTVNLIWPAGGWVVTSQGEVLSHLPAPNLGVAKSSRNKTKVLSGHQNLALKMAEPAFLYNLPFSFLSLLFLDRVFCVVQAGLRLLSAGISACHLAR
jgi:adenine deaminase